MILLGFEVHLEGVQCMDRKLLLPFDIVSY